MALLASRPGTQPDTRSLRLVICGAAPMPHRLIGQFEQPVQEMAVHRAGQRPPVGGDHGHDEQPHTRQDVAGP